MRFNVPKCGAVLTLDRPASIILGSRPIPLCPSYKHLGLPQARLGIEWDACLLKLADRMGSSLRRLYVIGAAWSPFVRLVTYRTFVLSLLDYVAGIAYIWLLGDKKRLKCKGFGRWTRTTGTPSLGLSALLASGLASANQSPASHRLLNT